MAAILYVGRKMDKFIEFITNHWMLAGSFVVLLTLLFLIERRRSGQMLSTQAVTLLLNRDAAIIVDVRDKKDFTEGHIKGAYHIPMASLKDRSTELKKHEEKQIVIVDKMGQHSAMAGKILREAGFEDVARLQGGMGEWRGNNLPVSKK